MRARFSVLLIGTVVGLVLGAATVFAQVANAAANSCQHWNVTGSWPSAQSNNYHVTFQLKQVGTKVTGTATNPPGEAASLGYKTGTITGTVKGSHVVLTVHWEKSSITGVSNIGRYPGTITSGHIAGNDASNLVAAGPPIAWAAHGPTRCVSDTGALTGTITYLYTSGSGYASGASVASQNQVTPARDVKVEVLAATSSSCSKTVLSSVFTEDTGDYTSAPMPSKQKYVCVKIDAVTPYSAIIPYSSSSSASSATGPGSADAAYATSPLGPYALSASGATSFSWKPTSVNEPIDQAIDISNAVLTGARWLDLYGVTPKFSSIVYPYPTTAGITAFSASSARGQINSDDAFDWGVLLHEYGHYVAGAVGIDNNTPQASPNHQFEWNMTDHENGKGQGIAIAWNEGFSDFFSQMVQRAMDTGSLGLTDVGGSPPIYIDQTAGGTLSLPLSVPGAAAPFPSLGEDNEASDARVLWDFYTQPMFAGTAGSITFVKTLASSLTSDSVRDLSHAVGALLTTLHAAPWIPNVGGSSTDASIPTGYNEGTAATVFGKILSDQNVAPTITGDTVSTGNAIKLEWKPGQPAAATDKLNLFVVQFWDSSWSKLLTEQVITDRSTSSGCPASETADLLNLCVTAPSAWTAGDVHVVILGWNTNSAPGGLTIPTIGSSLASGTPPLTGPYLSAPVTIAIG